MRRFRLAGRLGLATTALAFGLSLLSVAPPGVSAMPCGEIRDFWGNIVGWVDCPEVALLRDEPDPPCLCPDSLVRIRPEDLYTVGIDESGFSQQVDAGELAGGQLFMGR
jgi:hypothetical protein